MIEGTNPLQPGAQQEEAAEDLAPANVTEAETATNRAGISEDIDNQVYIEMNSLR
ncbi:MAG TPA: hypothetical protein VD969_13605 [Symbiobacteriaceae bacterium]|nr:hypothetical protein [Symbiobacteriaceae bacterium]